MKRIVLLLFLLLGVYGLQAQGSGDMLDFNGSSNYVGCGAMNLSGNAVTLQAWVKVDNFKSTHPFISSVIGTETAGNSHCQIRLGDAGLAANKVQFVLLFAGGNNAKLNGSKSLATNTWYHIAATYDGSNMKIYINGELDVQQAQTGSFISNNTFRIGYAYALSRIIDGKIDEVSVFKAALSQATIRNWMCRKITPSHPNYSSLEAYYPLDEGTGTSTSDQSPNSHNGTLTGSPGWLTSEIPLGNSLVHDFTSPNNLTLANADGDTFKVTNITGNPDAAYLYKVNGTSLATSSFPASVSSRDTSRYYGIYFIGGNNPTANVSYRYAANSNYQLVKPCVFDWYRRDANDDASWSSVNAQLSGNYFTKSSSNAGEFILGFGGASSPVIYPSLTPSFCDGDSIILQHGSAGLNYEWYINGNLDTNFQTNQLSAKQTGTYQLVYSLDTTCIDTSDLVNVTVNPLPAVSFPPITPVCESVLNVTLPAGTPSGGNYSSAYVSGNLFFVSISGSGTFPVGYNYTDANGCFNEVIRDLVVKPAPNVNLPNITPKCIADSAFNLSNGTPSGGVYTINGSVMSVVDPSLLGVGLHKIKYSVTDTNACTGADSIGLIVRPNPTVSLQLTDTLLCEYFDPITINGGSPAGGFYSGNGLLGGLFYPATGPGVYFITYEYTDPLTNCSASEVDSVIVRPRPARPTVTQSNDTLFSTSAQDYFWYLFDDTPLASGTQYFLPDTNDYYYVITENAFGCRSEASSWFNYVKPTPPPPSSVQEFVQETILVYPNPSSGQIFLKGFESQYLEVFNNVGQLILDKPIFDVDQLELPSGSYFFKFTNEAGAVSINKVTVL